MSLRRTSLAHLLAIISSTTLTAVLTGVGAAKAGDGAAGSDDRPWEWPLAPKPAVIEPFDPPDQQWSAGHRGVDLAGDVGQAVRAVDAGTVTYAGVLAGRGVVVISHGGLRSTYEPVSAAVSRGDLVAKGQVIGVLQGVQSHCLPSVCLHLGAKQGDRYLDPESLLGYPQIRLKSLSGD